MSETDYKPNEWVPVIDAESMGDKALFDTQRRLCKRGVTVKVKRRRNGKITLLRWGGWRS